MELPSPPTLPIVRAPVSGLDSASAKQRTQAIEAQLDRAFVWRTYRSSLILVGVCLLYAWSYAQLWVIVPLSLGAAISLLFLWTAEMVVERIFAGSNPEASDQGRKQRQEARQAWQQTLKNILLTLALIKYVFIAPLFWLLARTWDTRNLLAFAGGLCLVHLGIVLRVVGRQLYAGMSRDGRRR